MDLLVAVVGRGRKLRVEYKTLMQAMGLGCGSPVNHKAPVGGVTYSSFSVISSLGKDVVFTSPKEDEIVERNLLGIIKSVEGGKQCQAPPKVLKDTSILELDSKTNAKDIRKRYFRVPSVYSKSGWSSRVLTFAEVAAAMDLPVQSVKYFSLSCMVDPKHLDMLIAIPPVKILQAVGLNIFGATISEEGKKSAKAVGESSSLRFTDWILPIGNVESDSAHAKATKHDDALTETDLWNWRATENPSGNENFIIAKGIYSVNQHLVLFEGLREIMLRRFRRNVTRSFTKYLRQTYPQGDFTNDTDLQRERAKDIEVGIDCIRRVTGCSFWDWDSGSTLFYWRWQVEFKLDARDGTPICVKGQLPDYRRPQQLPKDEIRKDQMAAKLNKARHRRYISLGPVRSLIPYFPIKKGLLDIRLICDASKRGLNESLWVATFWTPTIDNVLDCATATSWDRDVNAGEMFLNYTLDPKIRPYDGTVRP